MAVLGYFELEGKQMNLISCEYSFNQSIDQNLRPDTVVRGGLINITVEATSDETIHLWMTSNDMQKDGKFVFKGNEIESAMRTVEFKKGVCVQFRERFAAHSEQPMLISCSIAAMEISTGKMSHINKW